MFGVRAFIFGLPLLLCGIVAAAFYSEKNTQAHHKNELISASIGEAHNLNPVQSSDAAASEVESWVCNTLVKYDENLEVVGDLADSWEQKQTTTIFFFNETDAKSAALKVQQAADRWTDWSLVSAEPNGAELHLNFSIPGPKGSREVFALLDHSKIAPLTIVRAELKQAAQQYASNFRKSAVTAPLVKRSWIESSGAFEFTVAGDTKRVVDELQTALGANKSLAANVTTTDKMDYLQEPEIVFHLHKGVKWHDGAPFTAKDMVFTFQKVMDESVASPRKPDFDLFQLVEAPDPLTVRAVCRKPFSLALLAWMIP